MENLHKSGSFEKGAIVFEYNGEKTKRKEMEIQSHKFKLVDSPTLEPSGGMFRGRSCCGNCPEGLTCTLVFAIFAAVLGMVQFGYNTGVINAPQRVIRQFIADVYRSRWEHEISEDFQDLLWSIIVSIFAIGGMFGGIIGGTAANRFGRKGGLLLNNILGVGGAALMGFSHAANSVELLILGRFIIGFNCGLNTALVPMYLSEISPLTLRGGLGTLNQLGVTIGLLLSMVLGIDRILGTAHGWPYLMGLAVIPAALQLLFLPMCPESPRFLLITKQREYSAREALERLRCTGQVEEDLEEMRAEERAQEQEAQMTVCQLLKSKSLQLPLVIGIVMQLSQQLSGINAVFYYSTSLFVNAGMSDTFAAYSTMGVGVIMVVMTLVSIPLMDRAGRRTLHLYGLGGMFICSIFITISLLVKFLYQWVSYMSVVSTLIFVVFFAIGPGSIPWMITAELFSQGPRPAAMSVAVFVNWSANFLVGLVFPQMQRVFEDYSFLPFTVLLAIFWTFTYRKVPETKNKTFEEIAALFRRAEDDVVNMNGLSGGAPASGVAPPLVAATPLHHHHPHPHPVHSIHPTPQHLQHQHPAVAVPMVHGQMPVPGAKAPNQPIPMAAPMATPMGTPMGVPMGIPMGTPMGVPMGTPMGTPMGVPMGTPLGTPMGTPMATPMVVPTPQPSTELIPEENKIETYYMHHLPHCQYSQYQQNRKKLVEVTANHHHMEDRL